MAQRLLCGRLLFSLRIEFRLQASPLEVLLQAMRAFLQGGKWKEAADIAKAAAPYVHPRAAGRRRGTLAELKDDELAALDQLRAARAGAAADDTGEACMLGQAGAERQGPDAGSASPAGDFVSGAARAR